MNPDNLNAIGKINKTIYHAALKILARRDHSVKELMEKLKKKAFKLDEIEIVITLLQQKNYLNDNRFAESYAQMRAKRGYGKLRIQAELKERGISDEIVENSNHLDDIVDIKKTYEKKFGQYSEKKLKALDLKEKAKQMRYLQYKGFEWEEIQRFFKNR